MILFYMEGKFIDLSDLVKKLLLIFYISQCLHTFYFSSQKNPLNFAMLLSCFSATAKKTILLKSSSTMEESRGLNKALNRLEFRDMYDCVPRVDYLSKHHHTPPMVLKTFQVNLPEKSFYLNRLIQLKASSLSLFQKDKKPS